MDMLSITAYVGADKPWYSFVWKHWIQDCDDTVIQIINVLSTGIIILLVFS